MKAEWNTNNIILESCVQVKRRKKPVSDCPKGCVNKAKENVLLGNGTACYRMIAREINPVLPREEIFIKVVDFKAPVGLKKCYLTLGEYESRNKKFINGQKIFKQGDTISVVYSSVYERYMAGESIGLACRDQSQGQGQGQAKDQALSDKNSAPGIVSTTFQSGQAAGSPVQSTPPILMGGSVVQLPYFCQSSSRSNGFNQVHCCAKGCERESKVGMKVKEEERGEECIKTVITSNGASKSSGIKKVSFKTPSNDGDEKDEKYSFEDEDAKIRPKKRQSRENKDWSNVWLIVEGKDDGKVKLWQRNIELIGSILRDGTPRLMPVEVIGVGYSYLLPRIFHKAGGPMRMCYQVLIAPGSTLWVDKDLIYVKLANFGAGEEMGERTSIKERREEEEEEEEEEESIGSGYTAMHEGFGFNIYDSSLMNSASCLDDPQFLSFHCCEDLNPIKQEQEQEQKHEQKMASHPNDPTPDAQTSDENRNENNSGLFDDLDNALYDDFCYYDSYGCGWHEEFEP